MQAKAEQVNHGRFEEGVSMDYVARTEKAFDQIVAEVMMAFHDLGLGVVRSFDLRSALAHRGPYYNNYSVLMVYPLPRDQQRQGLGLAPRFIAIYERDGWTRLSLLRSSSPREGEDHTAADFEAELVAILSEVAQRMGD